MPYDILIKFGKRAHMEDLFHHGVIYMNTLAWYRTQENDTERHDPDEGLERIMQVKGGRLYRKDPDTEKSMEIAELTGGVARFRHRNLDQFNVFCLFHFAAPDDDKLLLGEIVSERILSGFGDTAVVIGDAGSFVTRVKTTAQQRGLAHMLRLVNYVDLSAHHGEVGPFIKDLRFQHQRELRIAVFDEQRLPEPLRLEIGSLEDIALLIPAKEIPQLAVESY